MLNLLNSSRFLQIKATYYNPKSKNAINFTVKDSYKLIPMALRDFGKCFKLDVSKEVMPYTVYTYENVTMGACSIQSALYNLKDDGKQQFLDNLENWGCILGKGMDNEMFGLNNSQVFIVKWTVNYKWMVMKYLGSVC